LLLSSAGECYVGSWADGLRHGHGELRLASGDTYVGEWRKGLPEGKVRHDGCPLLRHYGRGAGDL
jgi:hypothetical protein